MIVALSDQVPGEQDFGDSDLPNLGSLGRVRVLDGVPMPQPSPQQLELPATPTVEDPSHLVSCDPACDQVMLFDANTSELRPHSEGGTTCCPPCNNGRSMIYLYYAGAQSNVSTPYNSSTPGDTNEVRERDMQMSLQPFFLHPVTITCTLCTPSLPLPHITPSLSLSFLPPTLLPPSSPASLSSLLAQGTPLEMFTTPLKEQPIVQGTGNHQQTAHMSRGVRRKLMFDTNITLHATTIKRNLESGETTLRNKQKVTTLIFYA